MAAIKHLDLFKTRHIKPAEEVVAWGEGYIGEMMGKGEDRQHNGVLIVTQERVVFYRKGFFGEVLESIPIRAITSIERKSLLGHHSLRLHTSHDSLTFKTFLKPQEMQLHQAIEERRGTAGTPAQASPGAAPPSIADSIRQLAELRDAGVLSDGEFFTKKHELLARM